MRKLLVNTIIRRLGVFALTTTLAFAGAASFAEPDIFINPARIAEFEYGLVCDTVVLGSEAAPDTELGEINIIDGNIFFTAHTTVVPAILGLTFGVRTRAVDGAPMDAVQLRITHPPFNQSGTTEQGWIGAIASQSPSIHLYTFDVPVELVTGRWTLSAHKDGELLYRIQFDVVRPENAPIHLKQTCKGDALTS